MLERLSDEAVSELGAVLVRGFGSHAAGSEVYSAALERWLLDACAREQAVRRGEAHGPLLAPRLPPAELNKARLFALSLGTAFENIAPAIPAHATAATRARYEALARELAPALTRLAEVLEALAELETPQRVH